MNTSVLKAKLYSTELYLAAKWDESQVKRDKLGRFSDSASSDDAEDSPKPSTPKTPTEAKQQVKEFVQDVFPPEKMAAINSVEDTPENRKNIKDVFNQIGKNLNANVQKAFNGAIDEVKKLNLDEIANKAMEKAIQVATSETVAQIAIGAAFIGGAMLCATGIGMVLAGVGTGAGGAVIPGLAGIIGGFTLSEAAIAVSRLLQMELKGKIAKSKMKEQLDKAAEKIPEIPPPQQKKDIGSEKQALKILGVDTEASESFKQKYKEKYGKDYDSNNDSELKTLNKSIMDSLEEMGNVANDLFQKHLEKKLDPQSPERKAYLTKISNLKEKLAVLTEKRKNYYEELT